MFPQFLMPTTRNDEIPPSSQDQMIQERVNFLCQIIRKMDYDRHHFAHGKRSHLFIPVEKQDSTTIESSSTIESDEFSEAWNTIRQQGGIVTIQSIKLLQTYWERNNSGWFVSQLIEEMMKCKYVQVSKKKQRKKKKKIN